MEVNDPLHFTAIDAGTSSIIHPAWDLTLIKDFVEKFLLNGDGKIVHFRRPREGGTVGNEITAKWTLFLPGG